MIYDASKPLAYPSLYRPTLEYANVVWDPSARNRIHDLELVQNSEICFISNMKGGTDSVFDVRNQLQLQFLENRSKSHRLFFDADSTK